VNGNPLISQALTRTRTFLKPIAIVLARLIIPNSLQRLEALQNRLHDWAQLSTYQRSNSMLALPPIDEHRVVLFGDSITEFWDLAATFTNKPYINRGIAGQTTSQMLLRFRPDVIALQPKVVLILAGTNDLVGNTEPTTLGMITNNYTSMAELARANAIQVIFASVLPIHDYGAVKQSEFRSSAQIRALNNWLKHYCTNFQHIYLDYYSALVNDQAMLKAEVSDDGVHPNEQGYSVMALLAEDAIAIALNKP